MSSNHPYTIAQLQHFANELKIAGSSDELMLAKGAMEKNDGIFQIRFYKDVDEYKKIYLTGVYEPLREIYNTPCPIVFWNSVYKAMRDAGIKAL